VRRAPTPPPKDEKRGKGKIVVDVDAEKEKEKGPASAGITPNSNMKDLPEAPGGGSVIHQPMPSTSSFAGTIASSLNMAIRFVLNHPDQKSPFIHPPPVPKKQYHNLLLVDLNNIDDRPHIKYDWTIGKKLKFSCTVYYAKQFELMRRRCGVDDSFLKSLERSVNWAAVGGKSRSNFWKTTDEKFIIKTLVNAWNVADLYVLFLIDFFRLGDELMRGVYIGKCSLSLGRRISSISSRRRVELQSLRSWLDFIPSRYAIWRRALCSQRQICW
jgi:1-phosphatidylinositol-3-phosphate 5-kinase